MKQVIDHDVIAELKGMDENGDFFRELTSMFAKNSSRLTAQIRAAIEAGNAKDAAAAAHQLKSSSGGLGARRVQDLCARIEKRALDGEAAGQGDLVTDLERELAEALAHIAELAGKAA